MYLIEEESMSNDSIITICTECGDIGRSRPDSTTCIICEKPTLKPTNITDEEFCLLCDINGGKDFKKAMIDLKEKDIIEFNLKMSQFKAQIAQEQSSKIQTSSKPKCPTCNSTNLKKISTTSKVASVAMWGIFSQKAKKTWHCNKCGYEW